MKTTILQDNKSVWHKDWSSDFGIYLEEFFMAECHMQWLTQQELQVTVTSYVSWSSDFALLYSAVKISDFAFLYYFH